MKSELKNEELVKRFLLGRLPESERAEVEDRFLADDLLFQEILAGEDDLIDAYARNELSAAERALFERRYLSTQDGLQRVEFARNLFSSISGETDVGERNAATRSWRHSFFGKLVTNRPALSFTMAAVLLLAITGGLWLWLEKGRTPPLTQQEQAGRTTAPVEQPQESPAGVAAADQEPMRQEKETPKPAPSQETPKRAVAMVYTHTLLPGMTRSVSDTNSLVLPGGATTVRLRLVLDGETYKQYRAALSTAEGRKIWRGVITRGISDKSAGLTLRLPAGLLESGDYILELGGANQNGNWESVADYSFRVVRK